MTTPTRHGHKHRAPVSAPHRTLRDEVMSGLRATRKVLPPKLFYDAYGAELFERITSVDEYYPTRSELAILTERSNEIAEAVGEHVALIEYGSGAGIKVRLLLDALDAPAAYVPIDISGEQLERVAEMLRGDYPSIEIHPFRADYTKAIDLPALAGCSRKIAFFPGSTIGNFEPQAAARFLSGVRRTVGDEGGLILGIDRRKDPAVIEAAYNDSEGVTAAFNLNVLVRLNRELGANFRLERFAHRAFFNQEDSRIEMHLVSLADQVVTVGGVAIPFSEGETIWTESSYKYDLPRLEELISTAGFELNRLWTDPDERFWVALLDAA